MSDTALSPLSRKLQLKVGYRGLLLDPPPDYDAMLRPLPADVRLTEDPSGEFDFVQLFVKQRADLARQLPTALAAVKPDGLLWICYPKGGAKAGTDLNRDLLWAAVQAAGWAGVTLIAVDDVWSAMRFRPADRVRSARSRDTH